MRSFLLMIFILLPSFLFSMEDVFTDISSRISAYKPVYWLKAITRTEGYSDSMVNVSFKYQIAADLPLYMGYTQRMFWDQEKDSAPFRDINYNPELIYIWKIANPWLDQLIFSREHLSNGTAGSQSRSWDRFYIKGQTPSYHFTHRDIEADVSFSMQYHSLITGWLLQDNPNIGSYIGNGTFGMTINNYFNGNLFKSTSFYVRTAAGGAEKRDFTQGFTEVGFIFNWEVFGINPRLFIQGYNGYAESLLEYDSLIHVVRLGVMLL